MDVDAAARQCVEHRFRQDLAVGHHDGELGSRGDERVAQLARPRRSRLDHGEPELVRRELDGGRGQLTAAPGGLVRLGHHERDLVVLAQRTQAGHREFGRAHEHEAHAVDLSPGAVPR